MRLPMTSLASLASLRCRACCRCAADVMLTTDVCGLWRDPCELEELRLLVLLAALGCRLCRGLARPITGGALACDTELVCGLCDVIIPRDASCDVKSCVRLLCGLWRASERLRTLRAVKDECLVCANRVRLPFMSSKPGDASYDGVTWSSERRDFSANAVAVGACAS